MRDSVCNPCCRVLEPGRLREAQIAILKHRLTPARRCQPTGSRQPTGSLLPPHAAHGSAADPQHRARLGPAGTRTPRRTRRGSPNPVMSPACGTPSAPRGPGGARCGAARHPRPTCGASAPATATATVPRPVRGPRREPRRREDGGKPGIPGRSRPHGGARGPSRLGHPHPWEVSGM